MLCELFNFYMDNVKPTFNLTLGFKFTAVIRFHPDYRTVPKGESHNCWNLTKFTGLNL
jgi:hypothetical protein